MAGLRGDAHLGDVQCDCGDTISPASPYVEVEPDGVLWHGNAQGGGHKADFDTKRARRTPDFTDLLLRDLTSYLKDRGLLALEARERAEELLGLIQREADKLT